MSNDRDFSIIRETVPFFLFRPCVQAHPGIEVATYFVLKFLDIPFLMSDDQTCCGFPTFFWNMSPPEVMVSLCARNMLLAKSLACKAVLVVCNACYTAFNHALRELSNNEDLARRIAEIIGRTPDDVNDLDVDIFHVPEMFYAFKDEILRRMRFSLEGLRVAVHYGCHYRRELMFRKFDDHKNPRFVDELLSDLGAEVVDYSEKNLCCGGSGIQSRVHYELSENICIRKLESIHRVGADMIVVWCPACMYRLDICQRDLYKSGKIDFQIPVLHLSQLIGLVLGLNPRTQLCLHLHAISTQPLLEKIKEIWVKI